MKKNLLLLVMASCLVSSVHAAEKCRYSIDSSTMKVGWTAYKTTDKAPVQGELGGIKIWAPRGTVRGLIPLVVQMKANGVIGSEKDVLSGNPARDLTLFQRFFALWGDGKRVRGSVSSMNGNDKAGELLVQLSINGLKKNVAMKYEVKEDGAFEAKGDIDVLAFGLQKALESLNAACVDLHKGKDGVSKTWSDVQVSLKGKLEKTCTSEN